MQERFLNLEYNKRDLKIRFLESDKNNEAIEQQYVLFIHGLGSSADRWLDIPDALSLYFHTLAIDLPGFGRSDKPSDMDYDIETFSSLVKQFIARIRTTRQSTPDNKANTLTLVGHSLGGYIASKIAATSGIEFLDKLVLIDSSGNLEGTTPLLDQYLDAAMNPSKEKVRKVFEQMVANPLLVSDTLVQGFINRISKPESKYAFESSLRNSANTKIGKNNLNKIGEKGIPTLIMWGAHDRVIPIQHSEFFRGSIKDSSVIVIPGTGHAPFTEKPALACEYLHRFLIGK
jgi:2-hydroxy-6-oxonona-2,4-dienedioate hydrolase